MAGRPGLCLHQVPPVVSAALALPSARFLQEASEPLPSSSPAKEHFFSRGWRAACFGFCLIPSVASVEMGETRSAVLSCPFRPVLCEVLGLFCRVCGTRRAVNLHMYGLEAPWGGRGLGLRREQETPPWLCLGQETQHPGHWQLELPLVVGALAAGRSGQGCPSPGVPKWPVQSPFTPLEQLLGLTPTNSGAPLPLPIPAEATQWVKHES